MTRLRVVALAVAAFAFSSTASATAPPDSSEPAATEPCGPPDPAATGASEPPSTQPSLPAWQTLEIVDVDGAAFTLADCIGTPVLVELFATWCSNCRAQMPDTQEAAVTMGDQAAVIALSVETDLDSGAVADYATDNELPDIRFAVMSPELLAAFVEAFGNTAANPPSTPKIVIDAAGVASELTTGPESAEELVAKLTTAAGAPSDAVATTAG